ncbi:MAG: beta-ketoacyl-[acyl-carrier-protein] synthase family protein [Chitinophagaceae bacterium]
MNVYITGIGVISAIGLDAESNIRSLQSGQSGIKQSSLRSFMLAEITLSNEELVHRLNLPEKDYSRTTLLAVHAAKEAWGRNFKDPRIRSGFISSTSVGGMDRTEHYYYESKSDPSVNHYQRMVYDNGSTTEMAAALLGFSGDIYTVSTACSSGANAIMLGARLLQAGSLDRVLTGASEPLALFDIMGFQSLNIYDQHICKPFDENRGGLNLGEGAAYLVLENEQSLSVTGNQPLAILSGWDNASDAFHQTASSPDGTGAYLAMEKALNRARLSAGEISYINAHGTGTGNNDLSESFALKRVFGTSMPPFSSTKGFTGHTLAAAGAIEAVYCVQSIQTQTLWPNLHFSIPMKETGMIPLTGIRSRPVRHVLSNSFGFGGNCSCLIFSKP